MELTGDHLEYVIACLFLLAQHCPEFADDFQGLSDAVANGGLSFGYAKIGSTADGRADSNTILLKPDILTKAPREEVASIVIHEWQHVKKGRAHFDHREWVEDLPPERRKKFNTNGAMRPFEHLETILVEYRAMCCLLAAGVIDEIPEAVILREEYGREIALETASMHGPPEPLPPTPDC